MNNARLHIENDAVYKQILSDSFGGIMYNVANRNKYDAQHLIDTWDKMGESEQSVAGGIMKGAIEFLRGTQS